MVHIKKYFKNMKLKLLLKRPKGENYGKIIEVENVEKGEEPKAKRSTEKDHN